MALEEHAFGIRSRHRLISVLVLVAGVLLGSVLVPVTASEGADRCKPAQPPTREEVLEMRESHDIAVSSPGGGEPVVLTGDLYHPAGGTERCPVVVEMTHYGATVLAAVNRPARWLAAGYAFLAVSVRGTGASGGGYCLFCKEEQQDTYDVVEWAAEQPWSDGRIGLFGQSASGITALLGAAKQPPSLRAVAASAAYSDIYRDVVWHNGVYNENFVRLWTAWQAGTSVAGVGPGADERRLENEQPLDRGNDEWDGPWYRERAIYDKARKIEVPTFLYTSWYDGMARGTIRDFQDIASRHKRLVIGPFGHNGPTTDPQSDYGAYNVEDTQLFYSREEWFDRFVKADPDTDVDVWPRVTYIDLGTALQKAEDDPDALDAAWQHSEDWPPAGSERASLFLSGASSGTTLAPGGLDGSLVFDAPTAPVSSSTYVYDPTAGATESVSKFEEVGSLLQLHPDQRVEHAKALTFTSPPFTADGPLVLAGPMELRFFASTTAPDTDWVVKVSRVNESGDVRTITSGFLRASHRKIDPRRTRPADPWMENLPPEDPSDPKHQVQSVVREYRVDVWPTAMTLNRNDRLRVQITSADGGHRRSPHPAENTIHHSSRHPSRLIVTTLSS